MLSCNHSVVADLTLEERTCRNLLFNSCMLGDLGLARWRPPLLFSPFPPPRALITWNICKGFMSCQRNKTLAEYAKSKPFTSQIGVLRFDYWVFIAIFGCCLVLGSWCTAFALCKMPSQNQQTGGCCKVDSLLICGYEATRAVVYLYSLFPAGSYIHQQGQRLDECGLMYFLHFQWKKNHVFQTIYTANYEYL